MSGGVGLLLRLRVSIPWGGRRGRNGRDGPGGGVLRPSGTLFVSFRDPRTQESIVPGSDYYTISASGVVHMWDDGSPAEFTPIGDWVREHSVFNMMKQV